MNHHVMGEALTSSPSNTLKALDFKIGSSWRSFDQFRLDKNRAVAVDAIGHGRLGSLTLKGSDGVDKDFFLVERQDFQHAIACARDIDRLRKGVRLLVLAVKQYQRHPEETAFALISEAIGLVGDTPLLPQQDGHDPIDIDEVDEPVHASTIILDPALLRPR